ncbi:MAG: acyl-CoA desaturase [Elusimicrobia bacterium]|jgi:stearoyl-CoA desaturase (delta-9 desaturase)|nr:acyl-CoA desaturase [Elusimicrobiota bacterium]
MNLNNSQNPTRFEGLINVSAFALVHLVCLAAFWTGVTKGALALFAASFLLRKFGITAGYHRYFSHRTFKTNRIGQFVLAWLACSAAQKGPLWWAGHHRSHHQYSDTPEDMHSPMQKGVWYAHMGWILDTKFDETNFKTIPDFARYPELRWLNKFFLVPPILWAGVCLLIGGWPGLIWGFFISTTVLWHTTFLINSACHLFGRRRFQTRDQSRNSFLLALVTLGEGWHNNHHYYPSSVNQGFYWWEVDITYYVLRFFNLFGIVWNLRLPPKKVLDEGLLARN